MSITKHAIWLIFILIGSSYSSIAQKLPPWQEGFLDIHHINTGSGNCSFFILPDGSTMIVDAGDVDRQSKYALSNPVKIAPKLPHDSLSAAQSIVSYIRRAYPKIKHLDYGIITHFHGDHYGVINEYSKKSLQSNYKLSGIIEVFEYLPILKLIDRDFPNYNYPVEIRKHHFDTLTFTNYLAFVHHQTNHNKLIVEKLVAGSASQIIQKNKSEKFPTVVVRNIKVNGVIWSGLGTNTKQIIPDKISLSNYNENPLCIALKISYGKFDYFTGGDLTGIRGEGLPDWFDVESEIAPVIKKVEALTLNHHGVRDATNSYFLKTLSPQVIVQQSWSSGHPGEEVLHRIISKNINPDKKDIFATYIHAETIATYGRWLKDNYTSIRGHVVIRVMDQGDSFFVYVLDDTNFDLTILKSSGPYKSN